MDAVLHIPVYIGQFFNALQNTRLGNRVTNHAQRINKAIDGFFVHLMFYPKFLQLPLILFPLAGVELTALCKLRNETAVMVCQRFDLLSDCCI